MCDQVWEAAPETNKKVLKDPNGWRAEGALYGESRNSALRDQYPKIRTIIPDKINI